MSRPLRVGLQLPEVERDYAWTEIRDIAQTAEAVGFDSLWVGDHLLYRHEDGTTSGPFEAWSVLAAVAEATGRVQIGPLVAATSFHSPAMLAKKAATVNEISGGRLILGLGAGWNETEYRAFGFPFDHRASRFEEAFTIIRTLLREGAIDFSGRFYEVRDAELYPRPRPGGPPLMIGSTGPRVLATALPHVDMWNVWHAWYGNTPAGLAPVIADVKNACRVAGRDPGEIEMTAAVMLQLPRGEGRRHGSPGRPTSEAIRGTPEELANALRDFAGLGLSRVQVVLDPIDVPAVEEMGTALDLLDT